jgi:glyoxylase I family protein
MPFTALGLEHITLHVKDVATAQKFYMDVLGCVLDRVNPTVPLTHLKFGPHQIDLVPGDGIGPPEAGLNHFCLSIQCDDIAALAAELTAKGAEMRGPIKSRYGAYGTGPSLYLVDPDGYVVELKPRDAARAG